MSKKNYNLPDYSDFNKAKPNRSYRPVLMGILAVFAVGYLIVYRGHVMNNQNTTNTPVSANDALLDDFHIVEDGSDDDAAFEIQPVSANSEAEDGADTNSTEDAYNNEETSPAMEESVMYSDARCVYQDGFFYQPITDDVKSRINGLSYKSNCTIPYDDLRYVSVLYYNFDNEVKTGELVCNKAVAQDFVEIFYELYCNGYQIDKIRLVDEYNADDDLSCADNNTSCFNFRTVEGSKNLSKHAMGLAIDINPFQNPYVTYPGGVERISPPGSEPYADRKSGLPHIIDENDLCYQLFSQHGFTWGGHWKTLKDYQHFQKEL